jgi:TPP-dependent pyruvate/acetoin dehydrogenase alpha subunit
VSKLKFSDINLQKGIDTLPVSSVSEKEALGLYTAMLRLRKIEEAVHAEYHPADEIRCPVHFCIGQEAVSASLSLLIKDEDYVFSHHRSHGYYFGKRAPIKALFAEMYGRETGADAGKAGSQDVSYSPLHFYSGAILSGATAIAAGAALSLKLKKMPYVAVAGFGEGATDEGVFWETVNYSALHSLPLVLICENNYYATYSPMSKRAAMENISQKVEDFGIKSYSFFGNDAINVYQNVAQALETARTGKGPVFLEVLTYRQNSHVGPEDDSGNNYRSEEEKNYWKSVDPVKLLEEKLLKSKLLSEDKKADIAAKIEEEIADAFKFAKESSFPVITDWMACNYHMETPLADTLLVESDSSDFNRHQADHIPAPY